jgi:hypothetical protein
VRDRTREEREEEMEGERKEGRKEKDVKANIVRIKFLLLNASQLFSFLLFFFLNLCLSGV